MQIDTQYFFIFGKIKYKTSGQFYEVFSFLSCITSITCKYDIF